MALFSGWFVHARRGGRRRRARGRRWLRHTTLATLSVALLLAAGLMAVAASHAATTRESVLNGTIDGEVSGSSRASSISATGQFVAFQSADGDLTGRCCEQTEVLLRDRVNLTTRVVSFRPDGGRFAGDSEDPSISADGTRIAFEATGDEGGLIAFAEGGDIWVSGTDGTDPRNLTGAMDPAGTESHPSVSPDGTRVAFERVDADGTHIWIIDIATLVATRVTDHTDPGEEDRTDHTPSWSPDGTELVFFTIYADANESYVHTMPVTGGALTIINEQTYDDGPAGWLAFPDWHPGGDSILFSAPEAGEIRLWRAPTTGDTETQITGTSEFDVAAHDTAAEWHPIGGRIVFQRTLIDDGQTHVFVLDDDPDLGWVETQITTDAGVDFEPTFNPDGTLVAFASTRPPAEGADPEPGIFTVTPGESVPEDTVVAIHLGPAASPHYSPVTIDPEQTNVYVHDTTTGVTVMASIGMNGAPADADSFDASLSADGRFVAFESDATNLTEDDHYNARNVFLRDLTTQTTRMVSIHPFCDPSGGVLLLAAAVSDCNAHDSLGASVNADGSVVAFHTDAVASDLVAFYPGEEPQEPYLNETDEGVTQVYVRTMSEDHYTIESLNSDGEEGNDSSYDASLSGDGTRVAFTSDDDLLNEDAGDPQIYLRDRTAAATSIVSVSSAGAFGNGESIEAAISTDGRSVAFASAASNLVEGDGNGGSTCGPSAFCPAHDIFLHDIARAVTERVSLSSEGLEATDEGGPADSRAPSASSNGRFVSFQSMADNLVPDDTNQTTDVFVRDRVPVLTVTPDPLDFGQLAVGTPSAAQNVTLTNTGSGPLVVNAITTGGAAAGDYAIAPGGCLGATLFAGESCSASVTFTPSASGPRDAVLNVDSTAPANPVSIRLTGSGAPQGFAALDLTPDPVDFGAQLIGVPVGPQVATGLSVGTAAVHITSVVLEGVDPGAFSFSAPGADTCTGASLLPGTGCQVNLTFTAVHEGAHNAVLVVHSDAVDSPDRIAVRGEGIPPTRLLTISPNPLDFGGLPPGSTSDPSIVTAVSIGDLPVQITDLALQGPDAGAFAFSGMSADTCTGALLEPGEGCQVVLVFTPNRVGGHEGALAFNSSALGTPHVATLRGSGLGDGGPGPEPSPGPSPSPGPGPFALEVTPRPVDFGFGTTRDAGERRSATVRNIGSRTVTVTRVATTGDDREDFIVVRGQDRCTGATLQPDQTCRLRLRFTPGDTGRRSATLLVAAGTTAEATTGLRGSVPELTIDPPLGRPGFLPTITGQFFPPNRTLRIVWRPGLGEVTVRSDSRGEFETQMLVLKRDRVGQRRVDVRGLGFAVFDRYLVVPGSLQPPDFTNRS